MQQFRFHSLGLPHTVSSTEYNACAFTQKIVKFSKMMLPRGHEIIHYGHEKSDLLYTEHITVTDDNVLKKAYGEHNYKKKEIPFTETDYAHTTFTEKTIEEIKKRIKPNDFVLCWWGHGHRQIADEAEKLGGIVVEPGIGYPGQCFSKWRAYESHCIRNSKEGNDIPQNWYSWVIPNYFDDNDFEYSKKKSDYFLFIGRINRCKGVHTIIEATRKANVKLKLSGQGSLFDMGYDKIPDHCEFLGYSDIEQRKKLMSKAKALIIASEYAEPFAGVQVEALLSGTPVIAPYYGAFAEILKDGKTGFLCHNFREYVNAIKSVDKINPKSCRKTGMKYTLDAVAPQYEKWFAAIMEVYTGEGWLSL